MSSACAPCRRTRRSSSRRPSVALVREGGSVASMFVLCLAFTGPVDLEELAARKDFVWTCDAASGRHVIRAGAATIGFVPGFSRYTHNGATLALPSPVLVSGGRVKLPADLAKIILANAADR